jgi:NADH:ubiquinone oxidoreductase subunit F (NADH-binding)
MTAVELPVVARVLPATPYADLDSYVADGGGGGIAAARDADPDEVIGVLEESGLRGRGGAGFPTGRKWRTVFTNRSPVAPATVVVNVAEGEPGAFKDRAIVRANPYAVIEGALIAAHVLGAREVILALKGSFATELARLDHAITEVDAAGWLPGVRVEVFPGPQEYLYGEETGLLEAIDGRPPFPRIAPPFRRGVDELVDTAGDVGSESSSAAHVELGGATGDAVAPPALVSNTETFANVPGIVAHGAAWFRSIGTEQSPGSIVVTVSGATARAGVAEVPMGTPVGVLIDAIGGGAREGRRIVAAASGVANALVPASRFDTPADHESLRAIGSGLGAAGFLVYDDATDIAGLAAGVARFLAVESCGQCTRCKADGLSLATVLRAVAASDAPADALTTVDSLLATVADGARCNLAAQQQIVVGSALELFLDQFTAHVDGLAPGTEPLVVAPITDLRDGAATIDAREARKQPDWTFDHEDSGKWPADRLDEHRDDSLEYD